MKKVFKNELSVMTCILVFIFALSIISTILYEHIPILINISLYKKPSFWEGFLINLHNSIFDFIFLGILLYYFTDRINVKRKKEEFHNNISDVRFLYREEATSKIIGNVFRLNELGCYEIDLSKCYLIEAHLKDVQLINSKLMGANLKKANLKTANLSNSNFKGAALENANLNGANLVNSKMKYIFCDKTNFVGANLSNVDFTKARLKNSDFKSAVFKEADLTDAEYTNSSFVNTNFMGAKNINISQICTAKTLRGAKFDVNIKLQIQNINSQLFI